MTRGLVLHEPSEWCQAIANAVHYAHLYYGGRTHPRDLHEAFTILGAQCADMREGLHWHAYQAISGHWRKIRTDGQIGGWLFL